MAFESQLAYELAALRGEAQPSHVGEDDYQSFSAALGASARGRAFLHEYAKRNRHADTEVVLEALFRLERVAGVQKSAPEAERIRQELRALLDTIHSARPQIELSPGAIKSATLTALIEFVQARIEALVAPVAATGERGYLSSVPQSEQPELPIPHPGSTAQRSIALVQPIASPIGGEPARPAPDPFVLSLDPRVGPVFGQQPGFQMPAPPRATEIIPEVNFIDSLFDQIDAKAAQQADADALAEAMALSPPPVANTNLPAAQQIAPAVTQDFAKESAQESARAIAAALAALATPATLAMPAAAEVAAYLPPLELSPADDVVQPSVPDPVIVERAEALARTATAIDSIVAAAADALAEAKFAEATLSTAAVDASAAGEIDLTETSFADIAFPTATLAEAPLVDREFVETAFAETRLADAGEFEAAFVEDAFVETAFAEPGLAVPGLTDASTPEVAHSEDAAASHLSEEAAAVAVHAGDVAATGDSAAAVVEESMAIDPVSEPETLASAVLPATGNIAQVAAGDPSQQVWDNALSEIMALSEEERLALFT